MPYVLNGASSSLHDLDGSEDGGLARRLPRALVPAAAAFGRNLRVEEAVYDASMNSEASLRVMGVGSWKWRELASGAHGTNQIGISLQPRNPMPFALSLGQLRMGSLWLQDLDGTGRTSSLTALGLGPYPPRRAHALASPMRVKRALKSAASGDLVPEPVALKTELSWESVARMMEELYAHGRVCYGGDQLVEVAFECDGCGAALRLALPLSSGRVGSLGRSACHVAPKCVPAARTVARLASEQWEGVMVRGDAPGRVPWDGGAKSAMSNMLSKPSSMASKLGARCSATCLGAASRRSCLCAGWRAIASTPSRTAG